MVTINPQTDYFQGDPKLFIGSDGAYIIYVNGQPIMEQGIENQILIALFTQPGWCGNALLKNENHKIGSDFMDAHIQPINMSTLNSIRLAAQRALKSDIFGDVSVLVENPVANKVRTTITVRSKFYEPKQLIVIKFGMDWVIQLNTLIK